MCGRYYRRSDKQRISEAFHLGKLPDDFVLPPWDYNVAPTTHQPIIRHTKETGERELVVMRWGLVPHLAKTKQPFGFGMSNGQPFAFAGLWDAWKDPAGGWLQSFSIITTEANELMASVHNRMPVILKPEDYTRWLTRDPGSAIGMGHGNPPLDLLRPFDADKMESSPANPSVGNVRNNGPDMLNSA